MIDHRILHENDLHTVDELLQCAVRIKENAHKTIPGAVEYEVAILQSVLTGCTAEICYRLELLIDKLEVR